MADESYKHFNEKTGNVEERVDKPTTFPYMNPETGAIEQRSLYPGMFTKLVENFKDPAAVDIQRERYLKTLGLLGQSAPAPTTWHSK